MIIKGGVVFQEDMTFAKKDIVIEKGRIVEVRESGDFTMQNSCGNEGEEEFIKQTIGAEEVIDATGLYVIPGLIDIHSHGAVGHDFSDGDPEGLKEILAYQYAHGVTSYCPTSMTLKREKLLEVYKQIGDWMGQDGELLPPGKSKADFEKSLQEDRNIARIIGFNMEGPFLDPAKKGAHKEEDILLPDVDFFRECNQVCGNRIRLVTVAPDVNGAMGFIRKISKSQKKELSGKLTETNMLEKNAEWTEKDGIIISLGHTDADYDTAKKAFEAGASHVTHLFNAMSPMNHRNPGLIGAAAENENCMVELICDGVHVHESMVRVAFKLFPGRIVLISDSMRATGLIDGEYDLGGQQVVVKGNLATLEDGTIAGSVTNLFDCMRKTIEFGIPAEEAVAAATMNPAKSIGIFEEVGSITPGKRADLILVDKDWKLVKILA